MMLKSKNARSIILLITGIVSLVFTREIKADTLPEITLYKPFTGKVDDNPCAVERDSSGNIYVVSQSNSGDLPHTPGAFFTGRSSTTFNILVTKMTRSGDVVYSAIINSPTTTNRCGGAYVDNRGRVYVTGWTYADDFPTTLNAYQRTFEGGSDAFVFILNSDGSNLDYSTLFGGSDYEWPLSIDVDSRGRIWIAGYTGDGSVAGFIPHGDLPLQNAAQTSLRGNSDGFVTVIDPTLAPGAQLIYSTYLGGDSSELIRSIKINNRGDVFVAGSSSSNNYPVRNAFQNTLNGTSDAVITQIDSDQVGAATLVYSTYFGGSRRESAADEIDFTSDGKIVFSGSSDSLDIPLSSSPFDRDCGIGATCDGSFDAFWAMIDPRASGSSQLVYSTYFGGSGFDRGQALSVRNNKMVLGGYSQSTNLPSADNTRGAETGGHNVFVSLWSLTPRPSLDNNVILQGRDDDLITDILIEPSNDVLLVGYTSSPTFTNADTSSRRELQDGYLIRLSYQRSAAGSGGSGGSIGTPASGSGGTSGASSTPDIIPGQEYRVGGNAGCSLLLN